MINKSQQVRDYAAANPTAKAKEIGAALGIKPTYVNTILWAAKHQARAKRIKATAAKRANWKNISVTSSDTPMPITMEEPKADPVNHPAHYKVGGIETIDFIEAKSLNYNLGNVVKYVTRADHKGSRKQDLEKAIWYLKRELEHSL
jgi:hypothetical protein